MHTGTSFRDAEGREWTVIIDGYVFSLARAGGVNLSEIFGCVQRGEMIDPSIILDLAYYGCQHCSRIKAGKIDKEKFLRALRGQALTDAISATAEALRLCLTPDDAGSGDKVEGQSAGRPTTPSEKENG